MKECASCGYQSDEDFSVCPECGEKLVLKKDIDTFEIIMMYNYCKEDYKTNKFVDCFIDVESEKLNKSKRIYEG